MRKKPSDQAPPADADDAALFRAAIGADRGKVRAMPAPPPPPAAPKPKPSAKMARRDEEAAREEFQHAVIAALEAGDALSYRRENVPPHVLRRLARGEYAAQEELDLHGLHARAAESLLREFLRDCRAHGVGCVRIVHGKGLGSPGRQPVLKDKVKRWLVQSDRVLAFVQARADEGGVGALVVLLQTGKTGSSAIG